MLSRDDKRVTFMIWMDLLIASGMEWNEWTKRVTIGFLISFSLNSLFSLYSLDYLSSSLQLILSFFFVEMFFPVVDFFSVVLILNFKSEFFGPEQILKRGHAL